MSSTKFEITPLGGVGEIGSNMLLLTSKGANILIDVGILFPRENCFDINYLIPDLDHLPNELIPTDLVITHGHEDHIGAVFHLLCKFPNIKIHSPSFATELIRKKLSYKNVSADLSSYKDKSAITIEDIAITPFRVNHSIPDTFGLLIQDIERDCSVFYASDFKVDEKILNECLDFSTLRSLTQGSKLRYLMADSTNILREKQTPSESDLHDPLLNAIKKSRGRTFVTCFASNIDRIQTICDIALKLGKRIVPYGRSMLYYSSVASEHGYLNDHGLIRSAEQVDPKSENLIVLLAGCQGEFRGTMRRVALGEDTIFKPNSDDLFVFSSKTIPGNERNIGHVQNALSKSGLDIVTDRDALIHASGHASQEELAKVYREFAPHYATPVHGEAFFLKRHADFVSKNFPSIKCLKAHNSDTIQITSDCKVKITKQDEVEPILIHGDHLVIERDKISERRKLATLGIIVLSIKLESLHSRTVKFKVEFMGLPNAVLEQSSEFESFISTHLSTLRIKNLDKSTEELRIIVRRYFKTLLGYRPLAIVHFV